MHIILPLNEKIGELTSFTDRIKRGGSICLLYFLNKKQKKEMRWQC